MSGPGIYAPDPTETVTSVDELPDPKVSERRRYLANARCPRCGKQCYRDNVMERTLHDLGDLRSGRPVDLHVNYSQHHCTKCNRYFNADMSDLATPKGRYTNRVVSVAVRSVVEDGMAFRGASWRMWRDHRVFVPHDTIRNWVRQSGKKS